MKSFLILLVTATSVTAGELRCPTEQQIPQLSFSVDGREWKVQPDMGFRYVAVKHGDGIGSYSYVTCGRGFGEYSTSTRGKHCRFVKDQISKTETQTFSHGRLENAKFRMFRHPALRTHPVHLAGGAWRPAS